VTITRTGFSGHAAMAPVADSETMTASALATVLGIFTRFSLGLGVFQAGWWWKLKPSE
jgi:hypothetical protein